MWLLLLAAVLISTAGQALPPTVSAVYASLTLNGYTVGMIDSTKRAGFKAAITAVTGAPSDSVQIASVQPGGFDLVNVTFRVYWETDTEAAAGRQALAALTPAAAKTVLMTTGNLYELLDVTTQVAGVVTAPRIFMPSLTIQQASSATDPVVPDPFVCPAPQSRLSVNSTHVLIYLQYSSAQGKTVPYGRTPFTFATFSSTLANKLPWDPAFDTKDAFAAYTADANLFKGMCDPGAAASSPYSSAPLFSGTPGYPLVSNLTQQPPLQPTASMSTANFVGVTAQAAGCACIAFATSAADIVHTPADDQARATGSSTFPCITSVPAGFMPYYTSAAATSTAVKPRVNAAAASGGWALRQYVQLSEGTCPILTEALMVVPTTQLQSMPFVSTTTAGTTTSVSWAMFAVQVGSTALWNPVSPRVDAFLSKAVQHRHTVDIFTGGAIVTSVSSSALAAPAVLRLQDAHAVRLSASTASVRVRLVLYLHQTGASATSRRLLSTATLVLDPTTMAGFPPTLSLGAGYSATCTPLVHGTDGTQPDDNSFACDTASCTTIPKAALPTFLAPSAGEGLWLAYRVYMTCTVTASSPTPAEAEWKLPASEVRIWYGLRTASGSLVTDAQEPPFVAFNLQYISAPGLERKEVVFPLAGSVIYLNENTARAATLTDVLESNDGNDASQTRFSYSHALAFRVRLANQADQASWSVQSMLSLLVATRGSAQPSGWTRMNSTKPLTTSWCGLGDEDTVALLAIRGDTPPTQWPAQTTTALDGRTMQMLQLAYEDNAITDGPGLQGDLWNGTGARPLVVADTTGGFALPMRNRLRIAGTAGTYGVRMCSIVRLTPYRAAAVGGWFPLYPTSRSAAGVSNSGVRPVTVGAVKYYMPNSAPLRCAPDAVAPTLSGFQSASSAACVSAASTLPAGRRSLLQSFETEAVNTPTVVFEAVEPMSHLVMEEPPAARLTKTKQPNTGLVVGLTLGIGLPAIGLCYYVCLCRHTRDEVRVETRKMGRRFVSL
jgi:hypothetical protein